MTKPIQLFVVFPFVISVKGQKMATMKALVVLTMVAVLAHTTLAANVLVGGSAGWDVSTNLQSWVSSQTFQTGDTLTFSYSSLHSVAQVSKADYDACSTSSVIQSFTGGSTVVKLSSPGKTYYICGTPGHCSQGMKVEINTVSAAVATPPPASPVTPPPTAATPPPSKAPVSSPTKAPKSPPSKAPVSSPSKAPLSPPPVTNSPSSEPAAAPSEGPPAPQGFTPPAGAPAAQPSSADGFNQLAKFGMGMGVGMMMALVL